MCEKWLDIEGYNGVYQVSDKGNVRSIARTCMQSNGTRLKLKGKTLAPGRVGKYGHLSVALCKPGKQESRYVHSLVVEAFIGSRPEGMEVRHGSNGTSDNSLANLSYGTSKDNALDMRRDGTHTGKPVVRSDGVEFINMHVAAEESRCHNADICACCKGKRQHAGGYSWRYK